jgi:hypothetical protein
MTTTIAIFNTIRNFWAWLWLACPAEGNLLLETKNGKQRGGQL